MVRPSARGRLRPLPEGASSSGTVVGDEIDWPTNSTPTGTPASSVTDETTWGITPDVGTDTEYARQDHTHGSPDDPGSGGGVIVQDEGTPLTTTADTLNFVGSGVAATGTGTTKTITISGGGGGTDVVNVASGAGSVTIPGIEIADRVPTSPSGSDDEFDTTDTSDPITGWTTLGPGMDSLNANSDAKSHLHMAKTSPGAFQLHGVYKAIPSMPFTVTAKFTAIRGLGTNYARAGLMLLETGPGKIYGHGLHNTGSGAPVTSFNMGNEGWNSRTSRAAFTDRGTGNHPPIYLRMLVTSSTSIAAYWSHDGLEWYTIYTGVNPGFTIAHVGLYITGEDNDVACGCWVDWIRFT